MKARSAKAKGSRAEREVAEAYRHFGIDKDAKRMLLSGGAYLKGDVYKPNDPYYVDEVKNQERIQIWPWWEQAEQQAKGMQIPILHITSNHRPILTVMKLETYMDLRKEIKDLEEICDAQEKKLQRLNGN